VNKHTYLTGGPALRWGGQGKLTKRGSKMTNEENRRLISGLGTCSDSLISLQNLTTYTEKERIELSHITNRIKSAIESAQYDISELTMLLQDGAPCWKQ
jgi:hypothetical protein